MPTPSRPRIPSWTLAAAAVVVALHAVTPAPGQTRTWTATANTSWGNSGNWNPADVPDTNAEIALFSAASGSGVLTNPNLNGSPFTVGQVQWATNAAGYVIQSSGGSTLTLDPSVLTGGNAGIGLYDQATTFAQAILSNVIVNVGTVNQTWRVGDPNDPTNASGVLTIQGAITGSGTITKDGAGTLEIYGNPTTGATLAGGMQLAAGTTIFGKSGAGPTVGSTGSNFIEIQNGATLQLGDAVITNQNALGTGAQIKIDQGGTLTTAAGTTHNIYNLTLNGGTMTTGTSGTLSPAIAYKLNNNVQVTGTATSTITSQNNVGIFLSTAAAIDFNVPASAAVIVSTPLYGSTGAGNLALTKSGSGAMFLTNGGSTYDGDTQVNAGQLFVTNPSGSATGTGNVIATNSGSTFGGTGSIAGNLTVISSGVAAPGTPTAQGTLTVNGSTASLDATSHLATRLSTASPAPTLNSQDTLSVPGGTLDLSSAGITVDVSKFGSPTFTGGTPYDFVIASSPSLLLPAPSGGNFGQLTVGGSSHGPFVINPTGFATGDQFTLTRSGNMLVLVFTPVPEPACVMGVVGVGLGVAAAWRRRAARRASGRTNGAVESSEATGLTIMGLKKNW